MATVFLPAGSFFLLLGGRNASHARPTISGRKKGFFLP
jgi:hypothetical protein